MKMLDLFSGIGGFHLAAEWVWGDELEVVAHCEIEPFCQKVLKKHWSDVPIHDDIKTLKGDSFGTVDIITGGFPCQPFSVAGKQGGKEDDRYLWPGMLRVISEARPTWILGENVTGIIGLALDNVLADLEAEGYEVQTFIIPACAKDAKHRRDRVWIVAHSECNGCITPKKSWALQKQYSTNRAGRKTHSTLREQVAYPPPLKMWPTPTASMHKTAGGCTQDYIDRRRVDGKNDLAEAAVDGQVGNGTLNPTWVEWLMGYPIGWTDLKD